MAKFTSLEFMEALGLGYFDYNGAKILLRCLASKGIAKEVGKIRPTGKGRPQTVYELPDEITLSFPAPTNTPVHPPKKYRKKKDEDVQTQEEPVSQEEPVQDEIVQTVPVAESREYEFDDGWEDD
jgi:hypothetical protein